MFPQVLSLAAPAVVFSSPTLFQQESDTQAAQPEILPEVIVSAARSERVATQSDIAVTVVTAEELRATGQRSLPRMLGEAAGVWIQETNLGGGSAFLRGVTGNQVLILIDGVRLNDSTTRFGPNQSLNGIDPDIVDRIEVIRGPISVLYGSDAVGGAILIWTKRRANGEGPSTGGEGPLRGELSLDYRSQVAGGRAHSGISGQGTAFGGKPAGFYASISGRQFDDLRTGGGEIAEFTGFDGWSVFLSGDVELAEDRILRYTARLNRDFDVPRTDTLVTGFPSVVGGPPTPPGDDQRDFVLQEQWSHLLSYDDRSEGGFADRFSARLSYRGTEELRERIQAGSDERRTENDEVETFGIGLDWRFQPLEGHRVTFGVDSDYDDVTSSRIDTDLPSGTTSLDNGAFAPGSEFLRTGVFIQDEIRIGSKTDVTAGLRYSYFDAEFDAFDPPVDELPGDEGGSSTQNQLTGSLAVAHAVTDATRVIATVAQGFRAANLSELARIGSFGSGVELPNPALDPERVLHSEIAVDHTTKNRQFGFAGFYDDISDIVGRSFDPVATASLGENAFRRENQGKVVIYGLEGRWRERLGSDSPFWIDGQFSWIVGDQFDDTIDPATGEAPFRDVPFRRIPPFFGQVGLDYLPRDLALGLIDTARLNVRFAAAQNRLSPGDIADRRIDPDGSAGFVSVDLRFHGPLGENGDRGRWRIGIDNLLDQRYRIHGSGFDAPGFGLGFGLEFYF